jgi:hypothetical protein
MVPFENTWPYDLIKDDVYVLECPFCSESNVLLPLKRADLPEISRGVKRLLVFPCCRNRIVLVDVDRDYLLANQPLRNRR